MSLRTRLLLSHLAVAAAGIAVASINYRFGYEDPDLAVAQGVEDDVGSDPDVDGARLDHILRDCARFVAQRNR